MSEPQTSDPQPQDRPSTHWVIEAAGWYGTFAITGAYFALSAGWLEAGVSYQLLNLTGAIGVVAVCAAKRTWQPMALNLVWCAVAVMALLRAL